MRPSTRVGFYLALAAGAVDFATGVGLIATPAWTLAGMGVAAPVAEALIFVRFVGAFVGAVGAMYLWAAARPRERLRALFAFTLWPRGAAGAFTGVAVLAGALSPAWLSVTVTDGALVVAQLWLLARGAGRDE
jgi:hypothetical protein